MYACQQELSPIRCCPGCAVTPVDSAVIETRFLSDNPTGKLLQIRKPLSRRSVWLRARLGQFRLVNALVSLGCVPLSVTSCTASPARVKTIEGLWLHKSKTTSLVTVSVIHPRTGTRSSSRHRRCLFLTPMSIFDRVRACVSARVT